MRVDCRMMMMMAGLLPVLFAACASDRCQGLMTASKNPLLHLRRPMPGLGHQAGPPQKAAHTPRGALCDGETVLSARRAASPGAQQAVLLTWVCLTTPVMSHSNALGSCVWLGEEAGPKLSWTPRVGAAVCNCTRPLAPACCSAAALLLLLLQGLVLPCLPR